MKNRIIGLAGGAVWLVLATAGFVAFSLVMINRSGSGWGLLVAAAATSGLALFEIAVIRRAAKLPYPSPQRSPEELIMIRRFWTAVVAEIVAFVTVNPLFSSSHDDMLPALNIAIVGLHFIPLAWIFRVPRYYALGMYFCLVAAVTLTWIPAASMAGHARLWYVFPSLAVAPVVWGVAWGNLREATQRLAKIE